MDSVTCRFSEGGYEELILDDRVLPDRTCGQYEAGWWVGDAESEYADYFLSDEGILYAYNEESEHVDKPIGYCPAFMRRMRELIQKWEGYG